MAGCQSAGFPVSLLDYVPLRTDSLSPHAPGLNVSSAWHTPYVSNPLLFQPLATIGTQHTTGHSVRHIGTLPRIDDFDVQVDAIGSALRSDNHHESCPASLPFRQPGRVYQSIRRFEVSWHCISQYCLRHSLIDISRASHTRLPTGPTLILRLTSVSPKAISICRLSSFYRDTTKNTRLCAEVCVAISYPLTGRHRDIIYQSHLALAPIADGSSLDRRSSLLNTSVNSGSTPFFHILKHLEADGDAGRV